MNYEGLDSNYWAKQAQRVELLRETISESSELKPGRVIPEEQDLVIGSGRRLSVAVTFIDISGFSSRPSYTESEQSVTLRTLNLFFSEMVKIAEDYGATVEKNTGDGLLAYYEDQGHSEGFIPASQRAVSAALTMFAANEYLISPILRNSGIEALKFRVSIDYGPITIGLMGAPRRFNSIVAIGVPANFACKMLAHAQPGQIVLGQQAKLQLPVSWQNEYTELAMVETGWIYVASGLPYPLYRYTGRWARLA